MFHTPPKSLPNDSNSAHSQDNKHKYNHCWKLDLWTTTQWIPALINSNLLDSDYSRQNIFPAQVEVDAYRLFFAHPLLFVAQMPADIFSHILQRAYHKHKAVLKPHFHFYLSLPQHTARFC